MLILYLFRVTHEIIPRLSTCAIGGTSFILSLKDTCTFLLDTFSHLDILYEEIYMKMLIVLPFLIC